MDPTVLWLIGTLGAAVLALIGTRWLAGVQKRTAVNEEKLNRYESWDHLHDNLRTDYDRAIARAYAAEEREAAALKREADALVLLAAAEKRARVAEDRADRFDVLRETKEP